MASKNETIEIVEKLIELTQHNIITWQIESASELLRSPNERVDLTYNTFHANNFLRVYLKSFKNYFDETNFIWEESVVFEVVDMSGHTLFVFPSVQNSYALLNAIRYQTSNVGDFYNNLFNKNT